jgi:biotin transporter BioY
VAQLVIVTGGLDRAVALGTAPFWILDFLKVVIAALVLAKGAGRLRPDSRVG